MSFVLLVVAVAFVWACLGQLDVVVKAKAMVRPLSNTSIVKNPVLGEVLVKTFHNGQKVQKGDLLWKINTSALEFDKTQSLERKKELARKDQNLRHYQVTILQGVNHSSWTETETFLRANLYLTEEKRLTLICHKAQTVLEHEKALPSSMVTKQKMKDLELEAQLSQFILENHRLHERLKVEEELKALKREQVVLNQRLAELDYQLEQAYVTAPISGVAEEIKFFNQGDYLLLGEEVVRVVPESKEELKVELVVDSQDVAQIKKGMPVSLRFTALPPSEFGELKGTITQMPADSKILADKTMVFVLEASLEKNFVENRREGRVYLQPGMLAEGRIMIKQKNIFKFILEKLDFLF